MTEIQVTMQFEWVTCTTCRIPFMAPEYWMQARRQYGGSVHCPNGHGVLLADPLDANEVIAQLRADLATATEMGLEEQARRKELEAAFGQTVEEGDEAAEGQVDVEALVRERDEARSLAALAEESYRMATAELLEVRRDADEREGQHARELASLRELAERGRAVPAAVEVFTPPPLADVRKEPEGETSAAAGEAWRNEVKECPNCHKEFGPEPRHREHTWRRKKFCSSRCQIAYNQQKAKERQEAAAAPAESATGLMVPLAEKRVDETKPEPDSRPPLNPVPDAETEPSGLEAANAPEIVHPESPPAPAGKVSIVLVRQGHDLVIDRSDCLPPTAQPGPTFVVNGEPVVAPRPVRPVRPVRPDRVPGPSAVRPPVLPPAQQGRLPDPQPAAGWQPVVVGETIERLDNGNCPDCGTPLNAFKVCPTCKLRNRRTSGRAFGT